MPEPAQASAKPSSIPSWVTLGFVLGALFVWALPPAARRLAEHEAEERAAVREAASAVPAPAPAPASAAPRQQPIETIDNVFAQWGKYAVWDNDTTEVVLWDVRDRAYTHCFEVLRIGDRYYYRPIPQLTRPVLRHGGPADPGCPLIFTETQEQQRQWLGERNDDFLQEVGNSLRQKAAPPPKP